MHSQSNDIEISQLRAAVEDTALPLSERKDAAEHLVKVVVKAVPDPADDDPEVVELRTPWENTEITKLFSKGPNTVPLSGHSLPDAKAKVLQRRTLRAALAVVVDSTANQLERLAACERILEDHPQISKWRYNSYTPERMLVEVLPADSVKWDALSWRRGPVPVVRPPRELSDVWRF
jgi:hypothetical protein